MRAADIRKLQLIEKSLTLPDSAKRGGPVVVERFMDPKTGQCFDLDKDGDYFRETPVPKTEREIVEFGNWKPVEP